jgi:hypothetical protein
MPPPLAELITLADVAELVPDRSRLAVGGMTL